MSFEIYGGVLTRDFGQIAGRGMALIAAAGAIEKYLSGIGIAREQLLCRVTTRHSVRSQCFGRARVKKGRDVADLLVRQWHRRHALIWSALMNDGADKVTLHIVRHKRRADKVWPACPRCLRTMTEPTSLLKLFVPALDRRIGSL